MLNVTGTQSGLTTRHLDLTGTATDDLGVACGHVALYENDTGRYLQPNGTLAATFATVPATTSASGTGRHQHDLDAAGRPAGRTATTA